MSSIKTTKNTNSFQYTYAPLCIPYMPLTCPLHTPYLPHTYPLWGPFDMPSMFLIGIDQPNLHKILIFPVPSLKKPMDSQNRGISWL